MYELDKIKEILKSGNNVYESDIAREVDAADADDPVFRDVLTNAVYQLGEEGLYHLSKHTIRTANGVMFRDTVHRVLTKDQILKVMDYRINGGHKNHVSI